MLTPFTFHDIQRRVGDATSPTKSPSTFQSGALRTFQSKAREIFQASTENYEKLPSSADSTADFKLPSSNASLSATLISFDASKVSPVDELQSSLASFEAQKTAVGSFEAPEMSTFEKSKMSTNPFETSLNDPSSFVSSLTSLHLHLSEQR